MSDKWLAWKTEGVEVDKPQVDFAGKWKNELGSEMELSVSGSKLTGTYRTGVGAPGNTEEFAISGVVNGDLIAFVVSWEKYGSASAWVGQQTADDGGSNERIETKWQLVENIAESAEKRSLWGSTTTGSDVFTRST